MNRWTCRLGRLTLLSFFAVAAACWAGPAHAGIYWWDANGTTAGFGTAGGTWGTSAYWSIDSTGVAAPSVVATTTDDDVNFGTATSGLGAGTVTAGTVSVHNINFGSASGAITLSGGTITLGGVNPTITVNNSADTISSVLGGTAGLTKSGTGTLTLSGNNTFTGGTVINGGTIIATNATALGGSGANLTFAGTGTLNYNPNPAAAISLGTLTVNAGATATIFSGGASNSAQTYNIATATGAGTLAFDTSWPDTFNIVNASTFNGNLFIKNNSGSGGHTVKIRNLADVAGSSVQFQQNSNATTTNTLELRACEKITW